MWSVLIDECCADKTGKLPSVPLYKCSRSVKRKEEETENEEMIALFMPVLSVQC